MVYYDPSGYSQDNGCGNVGFEGAGNSTQGTGESSFPKYPGNDPAKSPGSSWEWRVPDQPGGDKGAWYNPSTGETLHPDLNHPAPEGPHWDYIPYKGGTQYRINPDGNVVPK